MATGDAVDAEILRHGPKGRLHDLGKRKVAPELLYSARKGGLRLILWRAEQLRDQEDDCALCEPEPKEGGGIAACFDHALDWQHGERGARRNLLPSSRLLIRVDRGTI
jgi:hypothetical protein